ncbi:hypothetical protein GCM10020220_010570 [Nonomuraea rubra]
MPVQARPGPRALRGEQDDALDAPGLRRLQDGMRLVPGHEQEQRAGPVEGGLQARGIAQVTGAVPDTFRQRPGPPGHRGDPLPRRGEQPDQLASDIPGGTRDYEHDHSSKS